jgi:hypothetical protein
MQQSPYAERGEPSLAKDLGESEKSESRWSRIESEDPRHVRPKTEHELPKWMYDRNGIKRSVWM